MIYLAYLATWISTAAATILGIYFAHSPWCLPAFVFPLGIEISHQHKDEQNEESRDA